MCCAWQLIEKMYLIPVAFVSTVLNQRANQTHLCAVVTYRSCQLYSVSANNTEHLSSSFQHYQNQTPVLISQVKLVS